MTDNPNDPRLTHGPDTEAMPPINAQRSPKRGARRIDPVILAFMIMAVILATFIVILLTTTAHRDNECRHAGGIPHGSICLTPGSVLNP